MAKRSLDKAKVARILIESKNRDLREVLKTYGICHRTWRRYRDLAKSDPDLAKVVQNLEAKVVLGWRADLVEVVKAGFQRTRELLLVEPDLDKVTRSQEQHLAKLIEADALNVGTGDDRESEPTPQAPRDLGAAEEDPLPH